MERWTDSWTVVNGSMEGWMDRKMDGWIDRGMDAWKGMNERKDGGGRTNEWTEGRMEEEREG